MKRILAGAVLAMLLSACNGGSTPASCVNMCASSGLTQCANDQIQTCTADSKGCLAWGPATACDPGSYCRSETQKCVACSGSCSTTGGTRCSGVQVQTCAGDAHGCLDWSQATACGSDGYCDSQTQQCKACTNSCPTLGSTQCSGYQMQTCQADSYGCRGWSSPASCGVGSYCDSASNRCSTCNNACSTEGASKCSGSKVQVCQKDARGCLVLPAAAACPSLQYCDSNRQSCQALPSLVTVLLNGAVLGPCKYDNTPWDGTCSIGPEVAKGLVSALADVSPYTAVLSYLSGPVVSTAITATCKPDPFGTAMIFAGGSWELEQPIVEESDTFVSGTKTTSGAPLGWVDIPFSTSLRVRVSLSDSDVLLDDTVGTAEIGYADLLEALAVGKTVPIGVADQTSNQLLFVDISVQPQ